MISGELVVPEKAKACFPKEKRGEMMEARQKWLARRWGGRGALGGGGLTEKGPL